MERHLLRVSQDAKGFLRNPGEKGGPRPPLRGWAWCPAAKPEQQSWAPATGRCLWPACMPAWGRSGQAQALRGPIAFLLSLGLLWPLLPRGTVGEPLSLVYESHVRRPAGGTYLCSYGVLPLLCNMLKSWQPDT
jgi:hypothetical protein